MTFNRILAVCFTATLLTCAAAPVFAAEDATAVDKPVSAASVNPYIAKIDKKAKEIGGKLDHPALEHLYHIREGFGVLRAVTIVQRDVSAAVKACAKDNAPMREGIQKRYDEWAAAVDPVRKEKEDAIDVAINAQTYTKPKEIKDYLKLIEQAAEYANRGIEKVPVTTEESCNKLSDSLDDTQKVIAKLLGEITIMPWPPVEDKDAHPISTPN